MIRQLATTDTDLAHLAESFPSVGVINRKNRDLMKEMLNLAGECSSKRCVWTFSALGSLRRGAVATVINLLTDTRYSVAYRMHEVFKFPADTPSPFAEFAFFGDLTEVQLALQNDEIEWGLDLQVGGWLVDSAQVESMLRLEKFDQGNFTVPPEVACALVSNYEFDRGYLLRRPEAPG